MRSLVRARRLAETFDGAAQLFADPAPGLEKPRAERAGRSGPALADRVPRAGANLPRNSMAAMDRTKLTTLSSETRTLPNMNA